MPLYEFKCNACATVFETIVAVSATKESIVCSQCGSADITKILSTVSSIKKTASLPAAAQPACRSKSGFS